MIEEYIKLLTVEEKISLLSETAPEIARLKIGRYHHGNEALHGVVRPGEFTVFPQAIAMAAAFNPQLLEAVAAAISDEARARHNENQGEMLGGDFDGLYNGLLTFWSPNLNTARDPRWGRTGETYGEDPYLIGECAKAFIKGLQGTEPACLKTVATPKHFVGNNEEHNRFECNAVIPREVLFDYYLLPFETAVKEGACESMMASYNAVNGEPCHASRELLTDILRTRWGFQGYVVSDCGAVSHLLDRHQAVGSPAGAAAAAINAGVDLECGSCGSIQQVYGNYLMQALDEGLVTAETIDAAVRRVLKARVKLGILGEPKHAYDYLKEAVIGCEKHQKLALRMAEESIVLLKNEGMDGTPILPRQAFNGQICLVGNQADCCQFGDYSGRPKNHPVTTREGLEEVYGKDRVLYVPFRKNDASGQFQVIAKEYLFHREGEQLQSGLCGTYNASREAGAETVRIDHVIDFEWENMAPDPLVQRKEFSVFWSGLLIPEVSGTYEFFITHNKNDCKCNGRFQVYLDKRPACLGSFELTAGQEYPIELHYENSGARPSVSLLWRICKLQEEQKHADACAGHQFPAGIGDNEQKYQREISAARNCDAVIVCLGLGTEYEAEGRDKEDLSLPGEQVELLEAVAQVNKNVIVTLYNGSSLTIPEIHRQAGAILECWYPGEQGGRAIANIISGKVSPSGRLPLTFYEDVKDLPSFQCYDIRAGFTYWYAKKAQYPFGYGLSYTSFGYQAFNAGREGDRIKGSVIVANTGERDGMEVLQIYMTSREAKAPYKLVWSDKIFLKAGEQMEVTYVIPVQRIKLFDFIRDDYVIPKGHYDLFIGRDAKNRIAEQTVIYS